MMKSIKVAVAGAAGRMGQRNCLAVLNSKGLELVGALEVVDHDRLGIDIGKVVGIDDTGIKITDKKDEALSKADVLIDFTTPQATTEYVTFCKEKKIAVVIGTTGLNQKQEDHIKDASQHIPIVMAPNMSLGVNLLFKISAIVAKALNGDYDCEIVEAHHNQKADAPSGTAMGLAQAIAQALKRDLNKTAVYGRHGMIGPRTHEEIGIMAVRGGDIVGDHTVYFVGQGERLELTHRAHSRDTFARGAIRAARWLVTQAPGLYSMQHVLGLE